MRLFVTGGIGALGRAFLRLRVPDGHGAVDVTVSVFATKGPKL